MISKFIKLKKLRVVLNYDEAAIEILNDVINYIDEISSRVASDKLVNVYLFNKTSDMERFIELKGLNLGVSVIPEGLLSYHEAWEGIPTVYLCHEIRNRYGDAMLRALVHHELTHALLHGELTYYILPADIDYGDLTVVESYILFVGVKDFEVSSFLKEIGLGTHQEALIRYHLQDVEFNETLVKTILFLLPFTDLFAYVDNEIKRIFRKWIKDLNALMYLKDSLIGINTFNKFKGVVDWYLKYWPRNSKC